MAVTERCGDAHRVDIFLAWMEWGTPHLGLRQDNPIDQIDMSYLPWARGTDMHILKESPDRGWADQDQAKQNTQKNSGKAVDIAVMPETAEVIARARSDLSSMWDGADEPQQRQARR